jgi:hypothetical protein
MKREVFAFCLGILATVWASLFFTPLPNPKPFFPTAQAQEIPPRGRACATAILSGTYALTLEGQTVSGSAAGPYAAVGVLTFDGQGGLALVGTQSYNGTIVSPSNFIGRYSLGDDCAGSALLNTGARFDLVADNGGRQINLLQTNPGGVITGIARKQ